MSDDVTTDETDKLDEFLASLGLNEAEQQAAMEISHIVARATSDPRPVMRLRHASGNNPIRSAQIRNAGIAICLKAFMLFTENDMAWNPTATKCNCEFDPNSGDDGESWHYLRECLACGATWHGLHCPHDGVQNPCPRCGKRPDVVPTK